MNPRISTCRGCQARGSGLKSRIAIPHTCGLEPHSARAKRSWLENILPDDVSPIVEGVQRFYEIEDETPIKESEPTLNHKWGKFAKVELTKFERQLRVTSRQERFCVNCGARQTKSYYKNQSYPEFEVTRNGRTDVDCNPELRPKK